MGMQDTNTANRESKMSQTFSAEAKQALREIAAACEKLAPAIAAKYPQASKEEQYQMLRQILFAQLGVTAR